MKISVLSANVLNLIHHSSVFLLNYQDSIAYFIQIRMTSDVLTGVQMFSDDPILQEGHKDRSSSEN